MGMQIKKPTTGGQAVADRFKLDVPAKGGKAASSAPAATVNKTMAMVGLVGGLIALFLIGLTTHTIYQHWEFLKGA